MQVIKYLQDKKFSYLLDNLLDKISEGADGEVFYNKNGSVVKFSIEYLWSHRSIDDVVNDKKKVFSKIKEHSDIFVKLLDAKHLLNGTRKVVDGEQDYVIFFQEMEKMEKISDDEKRVFHTLVSHEDSNLEKDLEDKRVLSILDGLSIGLDFDKKNVFLFISKLKKLQDLGINYWDLHPRNIMKDSAGKFKLIDLDRISITKGEL